MELDRQKGRILAAIVLAFVAALLLVRLSSFGIWDPWELNAADQARSLAEGEAVDLTRPSLPSWLVAIGFSAFGVHEWAGRLPLALAGFATVALAFLLVRRFAGVRAGVYAALVAGTTPLFLLNARQMLGDAPAFAAQALVGLCAVSAVLLPTTKTDASDRRRWSLTYAWLAGLVVSIALAVWARGALSGVLPPLLAVAIVAGLDGILLDPKRDRRRAIAAWVVVGVAVAMTAGVVHAVIADYAEYSAWIGGRPRGGTPPTFEAVLEDVFHAFAPWSALALVALARMLWPDAGAASENEAADEQAAAEARAARDQRSFRLVLVLWVAFAYGALTLYMARYGTGPYVAVVPLAAAVALFLRDVEESNKGWVAAGVVGALLVGLVLRDFDLYPGSPVDALALEGVEVPEVFNPKIAWGAVLALFALASFLCIAIGPGELKAPEGASRGETAKWLALAGPRIVRDFVRAQWKRGWQTKTWIVLGAIVLSLFVLFGAACLVMGESLPVTSLVIRVGKVLFFLPIAIVVGVGVGFATIWAVAHLGRFRLVPVLVAGAIAGAYVSQGWLPALSAHFSPREVYDTYNQLARANEPLAEYRVGSRAAAYYAKGEIRELPSQGELVQFLSAETRRWAVIPADELAAVDRAFRQATQRHLFVPDASSARVVLATNLPIEGRENESFVAKYVLSEPPRVQFPVGASFEDKIELVGFDLDLPHDGWVGAGETFTVTWYWRALQRVPGAYKIFLHVDGQGLRLNGDHDPVDGKYPVRLWDQGDVVVDVQELSVPANYRPGTYTFFIGFYSGEARLEVVRGPEDDANRVRAGVLRIR